jgi:Na+-transporting methylmalonyl-CoA/oxaloacetate decarboxylase gamma subunit
VQFAASITLTANTLIDAVGSSIRSVSTSSEAVESYKRPPNNENYLLAHPGMTFFWLFLLFVAVLFYALHNVYYKVGDSTEDPQMAEQKDQQQQQQSTNIVPKRECFYISISYRI